MNDTSIKKPDSFFPIFQIDDFIYICIYIFIYIIINKKSVLFNVHRLTNINNYKKIKFFFNCLY